MKASISKSDRREFLKKLGLGSLPFFIPATSFANSALKGNSNAANRVNFQFDGISYSPEEYLNKLLQINKQHKIEPDIYGYGGATTALEEKFAEISGKQKAIYLPTGTMANQLAIKLLNGQNTKVIVPENSHIYRDEADAAQSVHAKRLIPVVNNKPYYNRKELDSTISELQSNEVFKSGIGTVVIENPVRRAFGTAIPLDNIKEISQYCKEKGYKMHLDAARIHLAEAYHNTSIREYSAPFDTVYFSLYKYLNAAGGAILCGDAELIDQVAHQIKIHGGTIYQNWNNTAMALYSLNGIGSRFKEMAIKGKNLIKQLNKIDGIEVESTSEGTNLYKMYVSPEMNGFEFDKYLENNYAISIRPPNPKGEIRFSINESILFQTVDEIVLAFKDAAEKMK
ncbi:L-threonine aldolase [Marivirga sericea]|uniref:L-threonine aldolase n=1 Tax=Marivirga sericea TaxID=1028 RepID=A0A1X7L8V7_9BACT|nr:aminotransferase class I/II-fold pyridoxal phosphate-dependent enzyme [Marivirga sericea]SMG50266.1 L-threonine aldolase [Marivirga sericea]